MGLKITENEPGRTVIFGTMQGSRGLSAVNKRQCFQNVVVRLILQKCSLSAQRLASLALY